MSDPLAEIKQLYFRATRATIARDFDRAIDLLKSLPTEDDRERATVFMQGLAEMKKQWRDAESAESDVRSAKSSKCEVRRAKSEVRSTECEVRSAKCGVGRSGVRNVRCGCRPDVRRQRDQARRIVAHFVHALRTSHVALRTPNFARRTPHFGLRTSDFGLISYPSTSFFRADHPQRFRHIAIRREALEIRFAEAREQVQRDRDRGFRVLHQRQHDAVVLHPRAPRGDAAEDVFADAAHARVAFDFGVAHLRAAQDRQRDQLVGVADQDGAHLAAALHRGLDLLRHGHRRDAREDRLRIRVRCLVGAVVGVVGVDEHVGFVRRRRRGDRHAARDEERAKLLGHVGSSDEGRQDVDRQSRDRGFGGLPDFGMSIGGEDHQQRELLERARSDRAARRQDPDVERDFVPPEEIDKRRVQDCVQLSAEASQSR